MPSERTTTERLAMWRDVTAHLMAILLTLGFFGVVFVALLGLVNLQDPTVATFIGTTTGYAIAQLARPLAFYFGTPRPRFEDKTDEGSSGGVVTFGGRP